jgi:hypothetical protein
VEERKSERQCVKCGHVNIAPTGQAMESCPACGAIYAKALPPMPARPRVTKAPAPMPMLKKLRLLGIVCVAWVAFLVVAVTALKFLGWDGPGYAPSTAREPARSAGDQHLSDARYPCKQAIEASAKYQARFKSYGTMIPTGYRVEGGLIIYAGDDVEMQNGFGAWQTVRYRCTFDPESGQASAVVMPR